MIRVLALFTLTFLIFAANAQTSHYKVLRSNDKECIIDVEVGTVKRITLNTPEGPQDKVLLDKGSAMLQKGSPDLPKLAFSLMIPNQKNSTIEIIESQFTDYPGISVAPSKGSLSRLIDPASVPYTYGLPYQTNSFFPQQQAVLNTPYILRDLRGQSVMIYPVQYNPISKVLRVFSHMKIKVTFDGISNTNVLESAERPASVVEEFDGIYRNRFVNYRTSTRYSPILELGNLLIVTPGKYLSTMAPFIQWKEQKGIRTFVVNTDTLTGGVNENTIRSIVKSKYEMHQIAYTLLVGDHADIPAYINLADVAGPSDAAYAYINNNDHYPDLIMGRFSGETTDQIQTQVDRSMQYEKAPNNSGNWMSTQIGIASNEGTGDDGQYDYEHIHDIVDSNKNQYVYTNNVELYDDPWPAAPLLGNDQVGDPDIAMLRDAINNGASLINYTGHGSTNGINTTSFSSSDITSLSNTNRLPFFLVVGCQPGNYPFGTSFAENLQRATMTGVPRGSIASFMSTIDQYWDEPMQAQDEFNAILRGARPGNLKSRLGAIAVDACMSMNDQYNTFSDPKAGSDMTDCWVFFGDPTLSIYTKNEGNLSVTHQAHIQLNSNSFEVNCPVNGAMIGLYYQNKFLASKTVSGGKANFLFPALTTVDTVYITATKQNYMPAFSKALVVNWPTSVQDVKEENELKVYPNPVSNLLTIESADGSEIKSIEVIDALGKTLLVKANPSSKYLINTEQLAKGIYQVVVHTAKGKFVRSFSKAE